MPKIFFIAACLLIFSSCANDSKNDLRVFGFTAESLERSNQNISASSQRILRSLDEKLTNSETAIHAIVWQPKAQAVSAAALPVIQYIATLKKELKDTSGYKKNDAGAVFQDDNLEAVNKIFIKNNKGEELHKKLKGFVAALDSVDEKMTKEFSELKKSTFYYLNLAENESRGFSKTYFNKISTAAALALLAKFENDVLNTENTLLTYCFSRTFAMTHSYEVYQPLIGLSSSYVKAGDKIQVTAGIGAFSTAPQPAITINNESISLTENGVATYEFKAAAKAGKYTIPVKIEFTTPDGRKEVMTKNLEYTVVEEK